MEVVQRALPAVVRIQGIPTYEGSSGDNSPVWGSGFFVGAQQVVTNDHVVSGLRDITITLNDGRSFPAKVFAVDRGIDIALLSVQGVTAPATLSLDISPPSKLQPAQTAIAIGSPFGQRNLVSVGVISGVAPFEFASQLGPANVGLEISQVIYTDARIEPGDSGGPLMNSQGQVVGVNDAVLGGPGGVGGLGLAIPANLVAQSVQDLENLGVSQRGWLGASLISLADLDPLLLRLAGLTGTQGAMINEVTPGSPAQGAGLRGATRDHLGKLVSLGDIILAVNGHPVSSRIDIIQQIARYRPGNQVTLALWRNKKKIEATIILTTRH